MRCPIVVFIAIGLANSLTMRAQAPAVAEFDAASIKPIISCAGRCVGGGAEARLKFTPGMVSSTGVNGITALGLILQAYHLAAYQLTGAPPWLDSDRFALEAKATTPVDETELRPMLQTLLAQRFKLVTHHETKEMPVYVLTIAKNGTKLHELKPGDPSPALPPDREGATRIGLRGTMYNFLPWFSLLGGLDRPIVDKTGLDGTYYFGLLWDGEGDAKTAAEDSFGLKFESQKAPIDIVVIDHIEKPSEN